MPDSEMPPPAVHREQLIYLLTEAAELEHGLMCSYLFASFTLRRNDPSMNAEEQAAVARWRTSFREVALEEMLHLVIVQNLIVAIGGAPHLQRPNFPVTAGLYPSGIVLQLRRFDQATLDHFVFLERPDGVEGSDGQGFQAPDEHMRGTGREVCLMASAQDYASVGALYRGIEDGFEHLTETMGEDELFIGDPSIQVDAGLIELKGLSAVTDLCSAKAAIAQIIEQGEGGRRSNATSHYDRFRSIREELEALQASRATFDPAQPVAANPVMHRPVDPDECAYVCDRGAAHVLDLGNAAYGLMVQILARFFGALDDAESRRLLADAAITLMSKVVGPVAQLLTLLPIGESRAGENAGLSFTLPRSTHALPQCGPAWTILWERAAQIAAVCRASKNVDALAAVSDHAQRVAEQLRVGRDRAIQIASAVSLPGKVGREPDALD